MNKQNKLTRAGLILTAVGVMVGLGGCSTVTAPPSISKFDKTGKGELYIGIGIGGRDSGEDTCAKAKETNGGMIKDERCEHPQDFYSQVGAPSFRGSFNSYLPVLIPKDVVVENQDIIKVQMKEGVPAYFIRLVTKAANGRDKTSDCYYDWSLLGSSGVVCPKYNWNYQDHAPSNSN